MKRREIKQGKRIVILCEGETEEIAVEHFIRRQWEADGLKAIGLHKINLQGKLEDIFEYVPRYRRDSRVVAVFSLIDLYGMNRVKHNPDDDLAQKVSRAKKWQLDNFEPSFFHPHISVHEIEAWLLAEGDCVAQRLKDSKVVPDKNAESKNFDNPPSKRIDTLFKSNRRGDGYHKKIDGLPLFKCLSFQPVYDSCKHFREFYDNLKAVGMSTLKQV